MDGQRLELTRSEFDLLAYLIARPGEVVTRRELRTEVWHQSYGDDQTIAGGRGDQFAPNADTSLYLPFNPAFVVSGGGRLHSRVGRVSSLGSDPVGVPDRGAARDRRGRADLPPAARTAASWPRPAPAPRSWRRPTSR